jgi:UDP-glucose 4-epimerase
VKVTPRRPGDPPVLVGTAERARAVLGWKAVWSALETQVADAWQWMQNQTKAFGRLENIG